MTRITKIMAFSVILCVLGILMLFSPIITFGATTIHVPGDQPTIQAGIDAAEEGDTVLVANGTYTGEGNKNLDFKGKAIAVESENGPENCIIDCEGDGRGFYFHSSEGNDSEVSGFTITNGVAEGGWDYTYGGGIFCHLSSPMIINCNITNNSADYGGGLYFYSSSASIINCTISENIGEGGGIGCNDSSLSVTYSTITGNSLGGISCDYSSLVLTECTISGNDGAYNIGGGIFSYHSSMNITNCVISGNTNYELDIMGHCWGQGGGIHGMYSEITITGSVVSGNKGVKSALDSCL